MRLSDDFHKKLLNEFELIAGNLRTEDPEKQLYYFSAIFGAINRVMNFECDPILVFSHQILQQVHQALQGRLKASRSSDAEFFLIVPQEMMNALTKLTDAFFTAFKSRDDQEIRKILQKFSVLGYATTGNGFYLYEIQRLKLE